MVQERARLVHEFPWLASILTVPSVLQHCCLGDKKKKICSNYPGRFSFLLVDPTQPVLSPEKSFLKN